MSAGRKLRSKLLQAYVSDGARRRVRAWHETRRKLTGGAHTVTAFLQLDDPYSYLLSRYLPALAERYDIELELRLTEALGGEFHPAPDQLAEYAVTDCARVAAELGLPFLDLGGAPPTARRDGLRDAVAAAPDNICAALEHYWRGDEEAAAQLAAGAEPGAGEAVIAASQRVLRRLGHYHSAMLHYGGEWYWGVDRLPFLLERLDDLGLAGAASNSRLASLRQVMHVDLPVVRPAAARNLPPLDVFYSFRSPYSHLALRQVGKLADAFGLELVHRPVLPMVMRGMPVPRTKARYILRDAAREAERLGVPFGDCIDPLGTGVERCHAVFAYAQSENRGRDFLENASDLIWAGGVDVATDAGMRKITAKTGLFWPEVVQAMGSEDWREEEAENRQFMLSLGTWGVPTFCLGDFATWGQDRLWLLARHLEELCDTGEGILV